MIHCAVDHAIHYLVSWMLCFQERPKAGAKVSLHVLRSRRGHAPHLAWRMYIHAYCSRLLLGHSMHPYEPCEGYFAGFVKPLEHSQASDHITCTVCVAVFSFFVKASRRHTQSENTHKRGKKDSFLQRAEWPCTSGHLAVRGT